MISWVLHHLLHSLLGTPSSKELSILVSYAGANLVSCVPDSQEASFHSKIRAHIIILRTQDDQTL